MSITATVLRALELAAQRHSQQRRKGAGGAPYVNHLIEVATLLATHGHEDEELLVAAVLHDVLEDTETTAAELEAAFGARVRELVSAVSDDKALSLAERREAILEHLGTAERTIKLIKLADLSSNVASIPQAWTPERTREYLAWCVSAALLCRDADPALYRVFEQRLAYARTTSLV